MHSFLVFLTFILPSILYVLLQCVHASHVSSLNSVAVEPLKGCYTNTAPQWQLGPPQSLHGVCTEAQHIPLHPGMYQLAESAYGHFTLEVQSVSSRPKCVFHQVNYFPEAIYVISVCIPADNPWITKSSGTQLIMANLSRKHYSISQTFSRKKQYRNGSVFLKIVFLGINNHVGLTATRLG